MEKIAELIERLDNISHSLQMPISDRLHVKVLRDTLPEIAKGLKDAYEETTGEKVWSE